MCLIPSCNFSHCVRCVEFLFPLNRNLKKTKVLLYTGFVWRRSQTYPLFFFCYRVSLFLFQSVSQIFFVLHVKQHVRGGEQWVHQLSRQHRSTVEHEFRPFSLVKKNVLNYYYTLLAHQVQFVFPVIVQSAIKTCCVNNSVN